MLDREEKDLGDQAGPPPHIVRGGKLAPMPVYGKAVAAYSANSNTQV
jgi:hypothetical protein